MWTLSPPAGETDFVKGPGRAARNAAVPRGRPMCPFSGGRVSGVFSDVGFRELFFSISKLAPMT